MELVQWMKIRSNCPNHHAIYNNCLNHHHQFRSMQRMFMCHHCHQHGHQFLRLNRSLQVNIRKLNDQHFKKSLFYIVFSSNGIGFGEITPPQPQEGNESVNTVDQINSGTAAALQRSRTPTPPLESKPASVTTIQESNQSSLIAATELTAMPIVGPTQPANNSSLQPLKNENQRKGNNRNESPYHLLDEKQIYNISYEIRMFFHSIDAQLTSSFHGQNTEEATKRRYY